MRRLWFIGPVWHKGIVRFSPTSSVTIRARKMYPGRVPEPITRRIPSINVWKRYMPVYPGKRLGILLVGEPIRLI